MTATRNETSLYAGIDLGGTTIGGVLADAGGRILQQAGIATHSHSGPAAVLERIAGLIQQLSAAAGARAVAVGIGCPGLGVCPRTSSGLDFSGAMR